MHIPSYAATLALLLLCPLAQAQTPPAPEDAATPHELAADLSETVVRIPVTVQPLFGGPRTGEMILTHFKPPGNGPFPAVVMQHGRSATDRANPGRWRYTDVARYWTRRGVAVFVPTRLGYGDTGLEPDPEFTGDCDKKNYDAAATAMNVQTAAAIDFATRQPWVQASRVIVMGQSMGGFASIAAMGLKHPGVIAGINFAGGGGGDPVGRRGNPCGANRLGSTYASAGKANGGNTPMLWLYAENDNYWGADIPRKWHEAYTAAGGKATLATFGPVSTDGHLLLSRGMPLWRPVLDQFIGTLGIAAPKSPDAPPATGYAALDDTSRLPLVKQDVRDKNYANFLGTDVPRAFAIGPGGAWSYMSGEKAVQRALERCAQFAKTACKLYAVDDSVVWKE